MPVDTPAPPFLDSAGGLDYHRGTVAANAGSKPAFLAHIPSRMPQQAGELERTEQVLHSQKRSWQFWSIVVLGLGLVGLGLAIYGLVRVAQDAAGAGGALQLLPPLVFGAIAMLVLLNYYLAQREAVIQGLQQELIKQKIESELNRELALLDPVTEVYNRRYLRVLVSKEISRVKRYGKGLAVMMLDVTGFRRVNESLGHTGGDVVLRQIAHLVQTRIRNSDFIVRFGGDEFLLVLPDTDDTSVLHLAHRIKDSLQEWSVRSGMTEFNLRLAIGVARYSPDRRVDEMLKLAEERMLQDRASAETREKKGRPAPAARDAAESPSP